MNQTVLALLLVVGPGAAFAQASTSSSSVDANGISHKPLYAPRFYGAVSGAVTGNAATATALAADPSNCAAGQAAAGITANGTAEGCFTPTGAYVLPDATASVTGGVRLTGDLGGTATSPTVPGLAGKLGTTAQAADSLKLNGQLASYYQTALGFTPAPLASPHFTSSARVTDNYPKYEWWVSDQAVNGKYWDLISYGTSLYGRVLSDDTLTSQNWLAVTRSGVSISGVDFPNGTISIGGKAISFGAADSAGAGYRTMKIAN